MIYTLISSEQASTSQRFAQILDSSLNWLDQIIWPVNHQADTNTPCFYVFKAFPANLKSSEIKQWIELQIHSLSPFVNGSHFKFVSRVGVHLWFSASPFKGVPETALQSQHPDGNYLVKGEQLCYQQTWKNGVLVSCVPAAQRSSEQADIMLNSSDSPWAVPRKLDDELRSPLTWTILSVALLSLVLVWSGVGYGITKWQTASAESEISEVSERLGPLLAQQTSLRQNTSTFNAIVNWQTEHGFIPESLATVMESLADFGTWKPRLVTWQNKTLGIEFTASDVDIASLVQILESKDNINQVTIRPHNAQDTWVLEAEFK